MCIKINHFSDYENSDSFVYVKSTHAPGVENEFFETAFESEDSEKLLVSSIGLMVNGQVSYLNSREAFSFFSGSSADRYSIHADFLNEMRSSPLPICVRYKSRNVIVVERPPLKINTRIRYGKGSFYNKRLANPKAENEIWIPWSVLVMVSQNGFFSGVRSDCDFYLFYRSSPLSSFDDILVPAFTPNVFADGRMCLGRTESVLFEKTNSHEIDCQNVKDIYNFVVNEYFSGGWNLDVTNLGYEWFRNEIRNSKFTKWILDRASSLNNSYILNFEKNCNFSNYGLNDQHFSYKKIYRYYMNYLSLLTLDEVNILLDNLVVYANRNRNNSKRMTLDNLLLTYDVSYGEETSKSKRMNHDYINSDLEEDIQNAFNKHCVSSSTNKSALHTWKLKINFHVEDFLRYSSDKILYEIKNNGGWSLYLNDSYNAELFYKKEISNTFSSGSYQRTLKTLMKNYFEHLSNVHSDKLTKIISEKILEISTYFKNLDYETAQSSKHFFEIDLSEFGIVKDSTLLDRKELTV